MSQDYIIADWNSAESIATSEGIIRPLIATAQVSLSELEIAPGEQVVPHKHEGLPYFEVILCIIEGRLEVIAGQERIKAHPGMSIMAHPDQMGWINDSEETVKALMIHAPPPAWKSAEGFMQRIRGWK
jgi:quercetin dioxygenase-like cupin family protein